MYPASYANTHDDVLSNGNKYKNLNIWDTKYTEESMTFSWYEKVLN